jgi:hypothetical protein
MAIVCVVIFVSRGLSSIDRQLPFYSLTQPYIIDF